MSTAVAPARTAQHPWAVVAPWWKWPDPASTAGGRLTRPELLKYETSKLVDEFIKNPQHSLRWMDEDLVHIVQTAAPIPLGSNGRPRRFSELEYVVDPLRTRKIFLDTHKRFYLVVCQIHCDAPGFPRADQGNVCEAGFVVRRRTANIPADGAREVGPILKRISIARGKVGVLDLQATRASVMAVPSSGGATASAAAPAFTTALVTEARVASIGRQRASTRALLELERERLQDWVTRFKVAPQLQGWFPDPALDKVGAWAEVDAKPSEIGGEAVFPMYPLIPAKSDVRHAGRFGTIYFGLLPTGTGETDTKGSARFDDQQYYEVTCYASRHTIAHDRGSPCKCPDALFWSQPTAPYRLAAHFDVVGTGRRPVTVQLPDLDELAAQATPVLGVAFHKPKNSLIIKGNKDGSPGKSGRTPLPEICSFSIPLITIVASFVFELFLPVVMLIFGLWFMLKLKFCILPEIQLSAGLAAEFSLDPGGATAAAELGIATDVNASIDVNFGGVPSPDAPPGTPPPVPDAPEIADALKNQFSPIATANMEVSIVAAAAGNGPDLSAGVEFEAEVPHP